MKPGFRSPAEASKKKQFRQLSTEVANLNMSAQVSQMMIKQLLQSNENQSKDLTRALNLINELQYKILALQTVGGFDSTALNASANALRLKDFDEASDAEDAKLNFTIAETVENDSTVIISTKLENGEVGIFRSRLSMAELGLPEVIEGLLGKSVGATVTTTLNGVTHTIELLGIRKPPAKVEPTPEATAPEATA